MFINFICAFAVAAVVYICAGLFFTADTQFKQIKGEETPLFAYTETGSGTAHIDLLGISMNIDYKKFDIVKKKFGEILEANEKYTPSVFLRFGEMVISSFSGVFEILSDIPDIAQYYIEKSGSE